MIYRALAVLFGLAAAGFAGYGLGVWSSGPYCRHETDGVDEMQDTIERRMQEAGA